jgi:DNA-binding NarL/FixJ family response regulator
MKSLYVRELTSKEYQTLEKGLKARAAFTVRRSHILLHSAKGLKAPQIAEQLHCSDETCAPRFMPFMLKGWPA